MGSLRCTVYTQSFRSLYDIADQLKNNLLSILNDQESRNLIFSNTFDPAKPELLVYYKDPQSGKMKLVAAEYVVPIELSPYKAPEGFTGNADVWAHNTGFGLWLSHAWVWKFNPEGVFNPTNQRVP